MEIFTSPIKNKEEADKMKHLFYDNTNKKINAIGIKYRISSKI